MNPKFFDFWDNIVNKIRFKFVDIKLFTNFIYFVFNWQFYIFLSNVLAKPFTVICWCISSSNWRLSISLLSSLIILCLCTMAPLILLNSSGFALYQIYFRAPPNCIGHIPSFFASNFSVLIFWFWYLAKEMNFFWVYKECSW